MPSIIAYESIRRNRAFAHARATLKQAPQLITFTAFVVLLASLQLSCVTVDPSWSSYYDQGMSIGKSDAEQYRTQDYWRHRDRFPRQYEDAFKQGYDAGYTTAKNNQGQQYPPSRPDSATWRAYFNDGKSFGERDAAQNLVRDHTRHQKRYTVQYEQAFKEGYDLGYRTAQGNRPPAQGPGGGGLIVDIVRARALLSREESLSVVDVPVGTRKVVGGREIVGRRTDCYAIAVPRNATLQVEMVAKKKPVYFNIYNVRDQSGAAIHRGEFDGHIAELRTSDNSTFLVRPFLDRAAANRGERAEYTLKFHISPR